MKLLLLVGVLVVCAAAPAAAQSPYSGSSNIDSWTSAVLYANLLSEWSTHDCPSSHPTRCALGRCCPYDNGVCCYGWMLTIPSLDYCCPEENSCSYKYPGFDDDLNLDSLKPERDRKLNCYDPRQPLTEVDATRMIGGS